MLNLASKLLSGSLNTLTTVIAILNFGAGIIGGIWIIALGGWGLVLMAIISAVVMPYAFSIAILPTILLTALWMKLYERNNKLSYILAYISAFINDFLIILWVLFTFYFFIEIKDFPLLPVLLLGYATAVSPLLTMAQAEKEDMGTGTMIAVFMAEVLYLFLSLTFILEVDSLIIEYFIAMVLLLKPFLSVYILLALKREATDKNSISCENCNETNTLDSTYCRKCGELLNEEAFYENLKVEEDPYFLKSIELLPTTDHVSPSYFQRRLQIHYWRASKFVDKMVEWELISPKQDSLVHYINQHRVAEVLSKLQ